MKTYEAMLIVDGVKLNTLNQFYFNSGNLYIFLGTVYELEKIILINNININKYHLEIFFQKKLLNYFDIRKTRARIESGAIIRDNVMISDKAIILMGAIINKDVFIGDGSMVDMNAVIGSGAYIGNNCHIGAGAVIAGVMEPVAKNVVTICDNVLIGANATILAGVTIGANAIVGAGSVVTKDVNEGETVVGVPAKVIKRRSTWELNESLR